MILSLRKVNDCLFLWELFFITILYSSPINWIRKKNSLGFIYIFILSKMAQMKYYYKGADIKFAILIYNLSDNVERSLFVVKACLF